MASLIAHRWQPITDLPADWRELCRPDLHAAHDQWAAARSALADERALRHLQERLMTVWAIETGVIERLYDIDRGVTVALAEVGLDAIDQFHDEGSVTADARALIRDQRAALDMVMDLVGGQRELTDSYIKELHRGLTEHQDTRDAVDTLGRRFDAPLLKGEWKRQPNNPVRPDGRVHEYCPPDFVQDEIDRLLAWHAEHEAEGVCRRSRRHGCTTASRRSTRSRTATAASPARSRRPCSSRPTTSSSSSATRSTASATSTP